MLLKIKHHFDAAHRLATYNGKCRNLHGHRWNVEIEVERDTLDVQGMIIDFGYLKDIIDEFDHTTILSSDGSNRLLIKTLRNLELAVIQINKEPTAENLAKMIHKRLANLQRLVNTKIVVRIWESPGAMIEYNDD